METDLKLPELLKRRDEDKLKSRYSPEGQRAREFGPIDTKKIQANAEAFAIKFGISAGDALEIMLEGATDFIPGNIRGGHLPHTEGSLEAHYSTASKEVRKELALIPSQIGHQAVGEVVADGHQILEPITDVTHVGSRDNAGEVSQDVSLSS